MRAKHGWGSKEAQEELALRQRETERSNARLLLQSIIDQEKQLDENIKRLDPYGDRWWTLVRSAGKVRSRRVELERIIHG